MVETRKSGEFGFCRNELQNCQSSLLNSGIKVYFGKRDSQRKFTLNNLMSLKTDSDTFNLDTGWHLDSKLSESGLKVF